MQTTEPGAPLAYSEEYLPGDGTYDDGEHIRAAVYGESKVDPETMQMTVKPLGHEVSTIQKGDIIVGRVSYVKEMLASVTILAVRGKEGSILQQVEGTLHASKIDKRYVKDVSEEYRCGDIIRAKVIGMKGGPQLVTDSPEFGVIKAYSFRDGTIVLQPKGDHLMCPEDGHRERRKLAKDYGSGVI